MKKIYIPKGQTVTYDSLETGRLVVNGCLKVTHSLKADSISGNGVIFAGTISADDIHAGEIEAAAVYCLRLAAKRVQAAEVFASESAAVSCYLAADYVASAHLTVALHDVGKIDGGEVSILTPKKRSLFRLLLASALRTAWASLTAPRKGEVMDAEYRQVNEPEKAPAPPAKKPNDAPEDEELARMVSLFQLVRDSGYTLKIIPNAPDEDAPEFGADSKRIDFPAA